MVRATGLVIVSWLLLALPASAATGRVIKVLPEFLDRQGRASLSPSLYERDAYQAQLRLHPEQRAGLRYYVQWKTRGPVWRPLMLRLEMRGVAEGNQPKELTIQKDLLNKPTLFTRWVQITLTPEQYRHLVAVTAWRVTLWEGAQQIGEQKSFLW